MQNAIHRRYFKIGIADLCRMEQSLVDDIAADRNLAPIMAISCLAVLAGTITYGAVFGYWRSLLQAGLSAVKLPVLIFAATAASSVINGMLAQVLGSGLSVRQTWCCILLSLAIASVLLGAFSPIVLFFVLQLPGPEQPQAMTIYRALLPAHTLIVGACGVAGNIRAYKLLRGIPQSRAVAGRVLWSWILIAGIAGCELSWVLSPFLAKPGIPVPFINPDAFHGNFFEYLWRTAMGGAL